jgi:hypothetical protein
MVNPMPVLGSLARITDFTERMPDVEPRPRDSWRRGDYVMVEMVPGGADEYTIETVDCSPRVLRPGDLLIGALGVRAATLEVVGDWSQTSVTGEMHALTGAGLFGLATSLSTWLKPLTPIVYRGHVTRDGRKLDEAEGHALRGALLTACQPENH